jgi:protein O-mannosyl-transferase
LGTLVVLALVAWVPLTRAQVGCWRDSVALFEHALRFTTGNYPVEYSLGTVYFRRKEWDIAREHYANAVRIRPDQAVARHALALTLIELGVTGEAIDQLAKIIELAPERWEGYYQIGLVLVDQGKRREALQHFSQAVRLNPVYAPARLHLGMALADAGQTRAAITQYREALKLSPLYPEALDALAWILATNPDPEIRNGAEAVVLAEQACQITQQRMPPLFMTLSAAYAEVGRFEEAAAMVGRVEAQATAAGKAELAERCRRMTELFAARQPLRERAAAPFTGQPGQWTP